MIQLSLCLVAVAATALGLFVWRSRPQNVVNRWFAAFTLSGAGWVLGVAGLHGGVHLTAWGGFTFASASLIPATFLRFAHAYPTAARWPSVTWTRTIFSLGVAFSLLSLTTPLIIYEPVMTAQGLKRKSGHLYPLFALYFIVTWSMALAMCLYKWRQARGQERVRLQYLIAAVLLSGAGAISLNLLLPLVTGRSLYSWIERPLTSAPRLVSARRPPPSLAWLPRKSELSM